MCLMVEVVGFEPTTYCVQSSRSSQLELYPHITEASAMLTRFSNPPQRVVISGAQQSTPAWYQKMVPTHPSQRYELRCYANSSGMCGARGGSRTHKTTILSRVPMPFGHSGIILNLQQTVRFCGKYLPHTRTKAR